MVAKGCDRKGHRPFGKDRGRIVHQHIPPGPIVFYKMTSDFLDMDLGSGDENVTSQPKVESCIQSCRRLSLQDVRKDVTLPALSGDELEQNR